MNEQKLKKLYKYLQAQYEIAFVNGDYDRRIRIEKHVKKVIDQLVLEAKKDALLEIQQIVNYCTSKIGEHETEIDEHQLADQLTCYLNSRIQRPQNNSTVDVNDQ